jgi:hypothetical protein
VHLSPTAEENVEVEEEIENSEIVMHQEETDKNDLESESEVPP